MRVLTGFVLLLLAALTALTAVNWNALSTPTPLSLIFATIHAPIGLLMLAPTAAVLAVFLCHTVYLQTSAIVSARRHEKQLRAQRELADRLQASRIAELRVLLEERLDRLGVGVAASEARIQSRLGQMSEELRSIVEQASNGLAAYIGEVDERLERFTGSGVSR